MSQTIDTNQPSEDSSSASSSKSSNQSDAEIEAIVRSQALTTAEALLKLHSEIDREVNVMKDEFSKRKFLFWLEESISFKSELSKMRWPSVVFMTAHAIAHFIVAFILDVDNLATGWVGIQGFILVSLLLLNLAVNWWDTKLRFKELLLRSEQILKLIKQCSQDRHLLKRWRQFSWNSADARTLFIPKSPCIHQTLTYRDESCLNLPDYLLVEGDIIHLYPGERAPGDCVGLQPKQSGYNRAIGSISLVEGQIYHGTDVKDQHAFASWANDKKDLLAHARLKRAHKGADFLMTSTPYIKSLRISLQRSHKRPVNSVEKECFIISRKYFETFVIPSVFLMSTFVTAIHYGYLDLTDSDQKIKTISIAYLLMRPSLTIMPFLPWMFPCFWLAINAYGSARLLCCADMQRQKSDDKSVGNKNYSPNWPQRDAGQLSPNGPNRFENLLATPTAGGSSENKHDEDDIHNLHSEIEFSSIFSLFIDLIRGKGGHVWRSSSLLQVLGCLTSLCVIDKVGIISWSDPTPEKVFVLAQGQDENRFTNTSSHHHDDSNSQNQVADPSSPPILPSLRGATLGDRIHGGFMTTPFDDMDKLSVIHASVQTSHTRANVCVAEILDVSQTFNCYRGFNISQILSQRQGKLQFDDPNWGRYADNLKPLGLAILLNNCCEESFGDYFRFYKHISYESIRRCNLTPVVKRRCVCAVSKLIGFSKSASKNYKYVNQIGAYKLIDPSNVKRGKLVTSLEHTTRLKLPFPSIVCNIQQDVATGGYQVFSQGTADAVLDTCVEYWNGKRLAPLDESARKKIMDFYHRTSLTSYCSAFSYTPLLENHNLGDRYIELPPENSKVAPPLRKINSNQQEEYLQNQLITLPNNPTAAHKVREFDESSLDYSLQSASIPNVSNDERPRSRGVHRVTRRHLSVEEIDELNQNYDNSFLAGGRVGKSRKLDAALEELTDQVFVGMVALQYQACSDYVGLVEQLEHACIRFIHFSKENELQSRVFSEKMGLESGWNCHISLQSDQDLDKADKTNANLILNQATGNSPTRCATTRMGSFAPSARASKALNGPAAVRASYETSDADVTSNANSISSDERTLYSWTSLPSLVMQLSARLSSGKQRAHDKGSKSNRMADCDTGHPMDGKLEASSDSSGDQDDETDELDESAKDEQFESLAFDMSNRAKLPKGIENIKPHLETVDNVPLQVSLFTDCTPELTKEMIEIMQEYGEIVCVIGSSSSRLNTAIFLQANASIAIEPLKPRCCTNDVSKSPSREKRLTGTKVKRRARRHESKYSKPVISGKAHEDHADYVAVPIPPRINNPRDRLGIRTNEPAQTNVAKTARPGRSSSSSSSSSSSGSRRNGNGQSRAEASSSSCSSSEASEFEEDIHTEDDLIDSSERNNLVTSSLIDELPSPSSLASRLASLPCSYSYSRHEPVNLYSLIMEARHFTFKMKNTFVCMICFALSISTAQFLSSMLFLPPMFSSGLTIWLTVVVVPLMSFSLMNTTMDSQVMKIAVGKNLQLKPENITFFVICYLIKFIPSIIVVVLSFGLIIAHSCKLTGFGSSSLGPCWMFTYVQHGNTTSSETGDEDLLWSTHLLTAQVCAAFLMVLYFVVISSGFVHRSHLMWQRSPTRNGLWVIISLILIIGQLIYNHLVLQVTLNSSSIPYEFLASLPLHIWLISFMSPVLVIGINLLVKRAEIKAIIRQQRRARFDFNTKLGMNSPF